MRVNLLWKSRHPIILPTIYVKLSSYMGDTFVVPELWSLLESFCPRSSQGLLVVYLIRSEIGVWRHPCTGTELTIFVEFVATHVKWNTCTMGEDMSVPHLEING